MYHRPPQCTVYQVSDFFSFCFIVQYLCAVNYTSLFSNPKRLTAIIFYKKKPNQIFLIRFKFTLLNHDKTINTYCVVPT